MFNQKNKKTIIFLGIIVIFLFFLAFDLYQTKRQASLLRTVKAIAQQEIEDITIFRHDGEANLKLSSAQMKQFKMYLSDTNNNLLEGHNTPIYEFSIIITTQNNRRHKFLASIREKDSNNLYLSNNLYHRSRSGSLWRFFNLPVKIPKAGTFILNDVLKINE